MQIYGMNRYKIIFDTVLMLVIAFVGLCNVNNLGFLGFFVMIICMPLLVIAIVSGRLRIMKNSKLYFVLKDSNLMYYNKRNLVFQQNLDEVELEFIVTQNFLHKKYILKMTKLLPDGTNNIRTINCSNVLAKNLFFDLEKYKYPKTQKVVELYNYGSDDKAIFSMFKDYSILNIQKFPPNNKRFKELDLEYFNFIFSNILNEKVERTDTRSFKIYSTNEDNIKKLKYFLTNGYENIIEITKVITNNDSEFVQNMSLLARDREKFSQWFDYYVDFLVSDVFFNWFSDEETFCLFYDDCYSGNDILKKLKEVINNLQIYLDVSNLNLDNEDAETATLKINEFLKNNGYSFIKFEHEDLHEYQFFLFITPYSKMQTVIKLGQDIGIKFSEYN